MKNDMDHILCTKYDHAILLIIIEMVMKNFELSKNELSKLKAATESMAECMMTHDAAALRVLLDVLADSVQIKAPLKDDFDRLRTALRQFDERERTELRQISDFLKYRMRRT